MTKRKKVLHMAILKPIQETPELKGQYAAAFMKEVGKKPTQSAIQRNKRAQELLRRMKK
ncbi:hypothetical protein [Paenibacillus xylanexedens]|uniref:hypothetical protein n=1 Tax=Paenibacillus xylanexedens TaxID=528191 RepID=UPI00142E259E|nr:hypothetical protein [Paenibacillus xylanexedens]